MYSMPAWLAPAIGAGASILGNLFNAGTQNRANRESRDFTLQMYNRQRSDALADWNMMNDYNSPVAQMQRFRDAKLNPNLIYGQGTHGNAAPVRNVDADSWRPNPAQYDFSGVGDSLSRYFDIRLKEAQTDNVRENTNVAVQEGLLKAANIASVSQSTAKSEFELGLAKQLRANVVDASAENLRKLKQENTIMLNADERAAAMHSASLRESAEKILNMRAERANTHAERYRILQTVANLGKDAELKDLDLNLKRNGIQPSDNLFFRVLGQFLSGLGLNGFKKMPEFKMDVDKGGPYRPGGMPK